MNSPPATANPESIPRTILLVPDGPTEADPSRSSDGPPVRSVVRGKSLPARCLERCEESALKTRVVLGTADADTANFARELGVEVVMRARPLAAGSSRRETVAAILTTLADMEPDGSGLVLAIDPNAPNLLARHLDAALRVLGSPGVNSVIGVAPADAPLWSVAQGREPLAVPRNSARFMRETGVIYGLPWSQLPNAAVALTHAPTLLEMSEESAFVVTRKSDLTAAAAMIDAQRTNTALERLRDIRLLVLDFDGVFTDNRVLVMQDGTEGVLCSRGDGMGLEMLRKSGLPILVLSKEQNPVVAARCRKLRLECLHGIDDKLPELKRLAERSGVTREQIAYVGNDTNDLGPMGWVGLPIAVADAHPEALAAAKMVLEKSGGLGAIRELTDLLLQARSGKRGD